MKGKRLLILGAAFALGLSACANSATMVREAPLREATNGELTRATSDSGTILFSEKGLTNGVQYLTPFEIDDDTTITFAGGGNDGKYYTTGSGIRTYGGGSFTIASTRNILKISPTWDGGNKPDSDVANPTGYSASTNTWTGSAQSITFTRPSGSGHWRLKGVTITYTNQTITVDNVKMRFGAAIPVEDWYDIEESWDIDYYGVMFLKYDTLHDTYGYSSIEDAYINHGIRPRADVHTNEGDMPLPLNGLLIFTSRINMTSELNYGTVYVAAPYLVIDGTHYFLEEMEYSVNSMAQEYLDNDLDSTLSNAALTKLATPIPQGD